MCERRKTWLTYSLRASVVRVRGVGRDLVAGTFDHDLGRDIGTNGHLDVRGNPIVVDATGAVHSALKSGIRHNSRRPLFV